jgi:hypothetical protein
MRARARALSLSLSLSLAFSLAFSLSISLSVSLYRAFSLWNVFSYTECVLSTVLSLPRAHALSACLSASIKHTHTHTHTRHQAEGGRRRLAEAN